MRLTRGGRVLGAIAAVVVAAGIVALVTRGTGSHDTAAVNPSTTARPPATHPAPATRPPPARHPASRPPPARCPLTDLAPPGGHVPDRQVLAVKVENSPEARPQFGLDRADLVYEEPVEGGITRFLVLYQCANAARIEPIRSGRLVDPDILRQFGHPILAYAGAIGPVVAKIARSPLVNETFLDYLQAFFRDPERYAPHNLYSSTAALYAAVHVPGHPPAPVFSYAVRPPPGRPGTVAVVDFSFFSDVVWRYDPAHHKYERCYGTVPAMLADGSQITASNVVVQVVRTSPSPYVEDVTGVHELYVDVVGSGPVTVLRDGRAISGTWVRPSLSSVTRLLDHAGQPIPLAPGPTWIELLPAGKPFAVH